MKFKDFPYERPDFEVVKNELDLLLECLKNAKNIDEFKVYFDQVNNVRNHVQTMATICSVRNSINAVDSFYDVENIYWDEVSPKYQSITNDMYKIVMNSPFKEELRMFIPEAFFLLADASMKSFDPKIIPLLQEENRLNSRHAKLFASAQIMFDGEMYNLSSIGIKLQDLDRDIRKRASDAKMNWFKENEAEIDTIFDELVKVRNSMAKELGYKDFVELGYYRMNRLDYDCEIVEKYRQQVLKDLVPLANTLYSQQLSRLGYDNLQYYDEKIEFLSGNPKPKGSTEELLAYANKMYHEMSKETGEFFDVMINQELFDLESKANKHGGGYCTDFPDYKVPFIFSNFNGTSGDVDVLTHEAGHAFQSYLSQKTITVPECMFPTMESAEIHSMSMEFFAHPWMNLFFKEDTQKYYYLHVTSALKFIPYGVLVDHFQHLVYQNPDCSADQRKKMWRDLEKQYLPHKNYQECDLLEKGCWWYQQGHIFESPFYYIDYTLAQVCALQFFARMIEKDSTAWTDYVHLCKLGGTLPFLKLLKDAGLNSPFEEGTLKNSLNEINEYLKSIDDIKL